jgi:hypothetical protein
MKGTRNSEGEQSDHKLGVIMLIGIVPLFVINSICESGGFFLAEQVIHVFRMPLQALCANKD